MASIVVISEWPLSEGFESDLFSRALMREGIYANEITFCSMLTKRPYQGDFSKAPAGEAEAGKLAAAAALRIAGPNVILSLGNGPTEWLTGCSGIDKWQASVLTSVEFACKVIPCYPADRLRADLALQLWVGVCAGKIKAESSSPLLIRRPHVFLLNPPVEQVIASLHDIRNIRDPIAVDIETGRGQINTVGFATGPSWALAINTLPDRLGPAAFHEIWRLITDVIESDQPKILQNFIYETLFFSRYGIRLRGVTHDTMICQKFLWPEFEMGLDAVGRMYSEIPYWKDDGKSWNNIRDWEKHYEYSCRDTTGTYEGYLGQRTDLRERGLSELYDSYIARLFPAVTEMCSNGLPVSVEKLTALKASVLRDYDAEISSLRALPGAESLNARSPGQVKKFLQAAPRSYKIPKKYDSATGSYKESTDEKSLKKLRMKYPDDAALTHLLKLAKLGKAHSSYLSFGYDADNRMRYSLTAGGTETMRWCLRRGTQISVPSGTKPIESMVSGDWIYCYDNNRNLQLGKVAWAGKTGFKNIIRIHWKTNCGAIGHLDCTPEHQIRLISGQYIEAQHLKPKMRTLALRRMEEGGYPVLWSYNKKLREHVFIFEAIHGYQPEIVHHKNGDKTNNAPENLEGMSISDHVREHALKDLRRPPQPNDSQRARGIGIASSKLTEGQVRDIKLLLLQGYGPTALAKSYGLHRSTIKAIAQGRNWKHVTVENHIIEHVEVLPDADDVYDIEVPSWHNFIANEICVHNSGHCDPWDNGVNPQTIPGGSKGINIKQIFAASPGYTFLQCDLRQAESRFVAYDSADANLIRDLEDCTVDIHSNVAAEIVRKLGKDPAQEKRDKQNWKYRWRQLGKKSGHGSNYDMGVATFIDSCISEMDLVLTKVEASAILEAYHTLYPGIRRWHANLRQELCQTRQLKTPWGWTRHFYGRMNDDTFKEGYAFRPQATIPYVINQLMLHLCELRTQRVFDFRLLLQAHDSILLEVPLPFVRPIAEACLQTKPWQQGFDLAGGHLIIPTEIEVGTNYGELKKYEQAST